MSQSVLRHEALYLVCCTDLLAALLYRVQAPVILRPERDTIVQMLVGPLVSDEVNPGVMTHMSE